MNHTESTFTITATDGHSLHAKKWIPDGEPVGVLVIIHGFYEHVGRYNHVAKYMNDKAWSVYAIDQRGHGLTKGKRGHGKMGQVLNDIESLLMVAREENTNLPMVIYGHSWGGHNVSNFILKKPVGELSGAILSSPFLRLAFAPPKISLLLGKIMCKIWPSLTISNKLAPGSLSKDPAVEKAYLDDPLVHDKMSAGLFEEIRQGGQYAIANAHDLKLPTLVTHGDEDAVIALSGSQDFTKNASDMASLHVWSTLRHEPHNEPEQQEVMALIAEYANKVIQ